jgi:pyruvate dehydrogenase E2 component (dihydrolipoamide acetyltransferase)
LKPVAQLLRQHRPPHLLRLPSTGCPGTGCGAAAAPAAGGGVVEVKVPDIGDFAEVPVIESYVKVGDSIKVDDAIATLESDKATMDVPSTVAGVIKEVLVQARFQGWRRHGIDQG